MAVDYVGVDVRATFGDSMLNNGQIIGHFAARTHSTHVCAEFNCIFATEPKQLVMPYSAYLWDRLSLLI